MNTNYSDISIPIWKILYFINSRDVRFLSSHCFHANNAICHSIDLPVFEPFFFKIFSSWCTFFSYSKIVILLVDKNRIKSHASVQFNWLIIKDNAEPPSPYIFPAISCQKLSFHTNNNMAVRKLRIHYERSERSCFLITHLIVCFTYIYVHKCVYSLTNILSPINRIWQVISCLIGKAFYIVW